MSGRGRPDLVTPLDLALPAPHFTARYSRWISATPDRVWAALQGLTLGQLPITRLLVAVRHLGLDHGTRSRNLFTDGPVRMLEVTEPWYAVGGSISRPWQLHPEHRPVPSLAEFAAFAEPGWIKYLTDFRVQPRRDGVQLTTVTSGCGTDSSARTRFGPYWGLIRPASGLIRGEMLAAVARAASAAPAAPPARP